MLTVVKIFDIFRNVASNTKTSSKSKPPSSSGLGHLPFTEATGIQIPLGVLKRSESGNLPGSYFFALILDKLLGLRSRKPYVLKDMRSGTPIRGQAPNTTDASALAFLSVMRSGIPKGIGLPPRM